MKAISTHHRYILALTLVWGISTTPLSGQAADNAGGDLLALQRLAVQAKSLLAEVGKLKEQLAAARERQQETEAQVAALKQSEQQANEQISALKAELVRAGKQIEQRDKLLILFRSGAFEYYEVQEGDTLESIAANPMVYGDKTKAPLIALVNDIRINALPVPGGVLIIPRFTEGASYEF